MSAILKPGDEIKPNICLSDCAKLLESLYGIECKSIVELKSYDDRNYKIHVNAFCSSANITKINENGYVLKILNKLDSQKESFVKAQIDMMLFVGKNNIKCPKPVLNKNGEYYSVVTLSNDNNHIVRLLEFLPGTIFCDVPPTPHLFYDAGKFIANLDSLLLGFEHPGFTNYRSLWMLDSLLDIRQFLYVIKNVERAKLVEDVMREFEIEVLGHMNTLEKCVIHGDFNEQNIVVRQTDGVWQVDSILDFGDCQYSCLLFELAVAITYMIIHGEELEVGGYFLAGYETIRKVPVHELKLLKICIAARLCQSLVIGIYSSLQNPDNEYILTTQVAGWSLLKRLWKTPQEQLLHNWKTIAETYKN